jgi:hypothetical protein
MNDSMLNPQYHLSELFNLGLNRKKFECISTKDKLFALNTSKNTFVALLFTLFASGQLFSGIIIAFTSEDKLTADFYVIFSILFIVGLVGLRQFLWLVNGRQEMIIENGSLTLLKKGTFFTKPKVYSFRQVENIRVAFDEDQHSVYDKIQQNSKINRKVLFGHIIGQISFDYKGETIKLFCDMNKDERVHIINEMTKRK